MFKQFFATAILAAISLSSQAALIDRGNGLIYDTELNVTWLQDANYAGSTMNWDDAMAWADGLNFGGFDDWRLPTINVTDTNNNSRLDCDYSFSGGTDCGFNVLTDNSELAYMFYVNLGNVAYRDTSGNPMQSGWDTLNATFTDGETGQEVSFNNLVRDLYWSGTVYAPFPTEAWFFDIDGGFQNSNSKKYNSYYAWALRDGDVAVNAPASLGLMGLAILGLVGFRRKA